MASVNYKTLPYSILGLLVISFGLVAVIFLNNHFSTVKAEGDLDLPKEEIQLPKASTEDSSIEEEQTVRARPQAEAKVAVHKDTQIEVTEEDYLYDCGQTARDASRYQFEVINPEVHAKAEPGEKFSAKVFVRNTGTSVWCGENTKNADMPDNDEIYKLRLGTALPQDHMSELLTGNKYRVSMQTPYGVIIPGETTTFVIEGVAPAQTGIYREYYSPVVEQLSWFHNTQVQFDLVVGEMTQTEKDKLYYLRQSGSTADINPDGELQVVIDVDPKTQKEYIYLDGKLIHEYSVSSGAWDTPTPVGDYVVYNKQTLRVAGKAPHYRMPHWIGLRRPNGRFRGYGMHALPYLGNNKSSSGFWKEAVTHLGVPVSHGCVRRSDSDAEWLWNIVDPEKTKIKVVRGFDRVAFEKELVATGQ